MSLTRSYNVDSNCAGEIPCMEEPLRSMTQRGEGTPGCASGSRQAPVHPRCVWSLGLSRGVQDGLQREDRRGRLWGRHLGPRGAALPLWCRVLGGAPCPRQMLPGPSTPAPAWKPGAARVRACGSHGGGSKTCWMVPALRRQHCLVRLLSLRAASPGQRLIAPDSWGGLPISAFACPQEAESGWRSRAI